MVKEMLGSIASVGTMVFGKGGAIPAVTAARATE